MTDLVERLTDEEITRIGETLGAKIVGHSDYESWGHGYRYDVFGRATIPNVPRNLIPFARAIEAEIIKRLRSQLEAANLANTKQAALEQDAARYRWLHEHIESDGYGYWLPYMCIGERAAAPTLDDFRATFDAAMKA